jgi:hypothetical protein
MFQHLFFLMEVATLELPINVLSFNHVFQHLFFLMEVATQRLKLKSGQKSKIPFQHLFFLMEVATLDMSLSFALCMSFNTFSS